MKKLLIASLLCCFSRLHADALSDAIRANDPEAVKTILATQTFSAKALEKYLDTAEQMIRLRKDQIVSQELRPTCCTSDPASNNCWRASILCAGISFVAATIPLFNDHVLMNSTLSNQCKVTAFLGLAGTLVCQHFGQRYASDSLRKLYAHALTIKEMLYDHAAQEVS